MFSMWLNIFNSTIISELVILWIVLCLDLYDTLVHLMNNTGRCVESYSQNISWLYN